MGIQANIVEAGDRWNAFVAAWPDCGLLQTNQWGEFKELMGWRAIRLAVEQEGSLVAGALVLVKQLPLRLASIAYVPRGPLVHWEDKATATVLLQTLHRVARQQRAGFLRIEPPLLHSAQAASLLQAYGFQATRQTNQPRCTLVMDLTADIDTIYSQLPRKARRDIRIGLERGLKVRQGNQADLATFYEMMRTTAVRGGFSARSKEYYQAEFKTFAPSGLAILLLAEYEGETIAAQMTFAFGSHGAVFHGASSNTHRHLRANDLLTWESVKWAKSRGCRSFDLWGLPDEIGELIEQGRPIPADRTDGLWGVYTFKKGFGGEVVYYVGAFDYVYHQKVYSLGAGVLSWLESTRVLSGLVDRT